MTKIAGSWKGLGIIIAQRVKGTYQFPFYINLALSEQGYFHATHYESGWDGSTDWYCRTILQQSSSD
nr:hypothetical protein [Providencia stuartii]